MNKSWTKYILSDIFVPLLAKSPLCDQLCFLFGKPPVNFQNTERYLDILTKKPKILSTYFTKQKKCAILYHKPKRYVKGDASV